MKKYVKPELFFESFELSQQIAACNFDSNGTFDGDIAKNCRFTGDAGSVFPGVVIFMWNCGAEGDFDASGFDICYHGSVSTFGGIFNS